ncbi:MAG: ABC transporter ATP-binding protein [Clostridia bacterium]|nr:ABC transporter ATP-binding protein [Clostridia bacterium]
MIFGKYVNKYYLKHIFALLLGVIALVSVDYFQLKIPEFYNYVVTGLGSKNGMITIGGQEVPFDLNFLLDKICAPMILTILVMALGRFLWRICMFGTAIKVETDLRERMFDHCKDLSQQYYQVNKVGNMMSLFTNDLSTINECFGDGTLMLVDALALTGLAIYKMSKLDPMLTLLAFIPMFLLFAVGTFVGKYMTKKWEERQEKFSQLSDFSQENFSGIAVIKAFVKEFKELWAFKKLNKENEKVNIEFTRISTLLHISVTFFVNSVICVILGYGGYLVYKGDFQVGQLIEFYGYFTSIVWPVMALSMLIDMTSRGKASLKRISELLDAKPDVVDGSSVENVEYIKGDIEFRNLDFAYPDGDYNVLENINFKICAGENVGIIGKTGSGKTTIVDLILRVYNVPNGSLFIDGKDVNTIPIKTLRDFCAYVPQDNFLFSDTIENNIAFSRDASSSDEVVKAAKLADVHENISEFPEKYATILGERGVTVSGGQKQRISIARALMKEASILILDDSVSAVDTKTEKVIIDNLRENRRGRTTILIAHRISTVEKMDKIIFVDDGKIKDVGTHNELVERCSDYKLMVELQKLEEEKGA